MFELEPLLIEPLKVSSISRAGLRAFRVTDSRYMFYKLKLEGLKLPNIFQCCPHRRHPPTFLHIAITAHHIISVGRMV